MNHYLIVCRSVTQAQRAGMLFSSAGITNQVFRSPVGLTERGCSYSVRIPYQQLPHAAQLLRDYHMKPVKIVLQDEYGTISEVARHDLL